MLEISGVPSVFFCKLQVAEVLFILSAKKFARGFAAFLSMLSLNILLLFSGEILSRTRVRAR